SRPSSAHLLERRPQLQRNHAGGSQAGLGRSSQGQRGRRWIRSLDGPPASFYSCSRCLHDVSDARRWAMTAVETRSTTGLLALTALRGVGPVTAERIANRFRWFDELSNATPAHLSEVTSQSVAASLLQHGALTDAIDKALRILDTAARS